MKGFDKQGHRGCRGLMPENTISAMIRAIDLGVTTLEMDVVITRDGQVILSHEPFFNHEITTKPDGTFVKEEEEKSLNIYRLNYEEIAMYDVGKKPHPRFPKQLNLAAVKPLLSALVDRVEAYCKEKKASGPFYNIETKTMPATDDIYHPVPKVFVEALMEVIHKKGVGARTIIQSFDFRTLQYLHRNYPQIKTAMLVEDFDKRSLQELLDALGFTPAIFSPHYSLATKKTIDDCHQNRINIIPWTVNEEKEIRRLMNDGVDGIITDYPDLFSLIVKK